MISDSPALEAPSEKLERPAHDSEAEIPPLLPGTRPRAKPNVGDGAGLRNRLRAERPHL